MTDELVREERGMRSQGGMVEQVCEGTEGDGMV